MADDMLRYTGRGAANGTAQFSACRPTPDPSRILYTKRVIFVRLLLSGRPGGNAASSLSLPTRGTKDKTQENLHQPPKNNMI